MTVIRFDRFVNVDLVEHDATVVLHPPSLGEPLSSVSIGRKLLNNHLCMTVSSDDVLYYTAHSTTIIVVPKELAMGEVFIVDGVEYTRLELIE